MKYRSLDEIISVSPETRVVQVFQETFGNELGAILAHEFATSPEFRERYQLMLENERKHREDMIALWKTPRSITGFEVSVVLTVAWGMGCGHKFKPEVRGRYNRLWKARLAKLWMEFTDQRHPREYRITPVFETL